MSGDEPTLIDTVLKKVRGLRNKVRRRWANIQRRRRLGSLAPYIEKSKQIEGWARGDEASELAIVARRLPPDAVVVEIGSFLGSSAVLLAGARKLAGSGVVHCIDPFDASGDAHSTPVYEDLTSSLETSIRQRFDSNIEEAGVANWIVAHEGTAEEISADWTEPIDLLFLDGDQSPDGARSSFDAWYPFLKIGGVLAVHNSSNRQYSPLHDGYRRVVVESVTKPGFDKIRCVGTTTFAIKRS